jgi:ABC-2 type transport system ATP-binding protein
VKLFYCSDTANSTFLYTFFLYFRENMSQVVLEINNLKKIYANQSHPALDDISLKIYRNEKVGVIGANGSGKTTLFRTILNLVRPFYGSIRILGDFDLEKAKKHLGFIPEHQEGLENFTPAELLKYAGKMSGMKKSLIESRKEELLSWTELSNQKNELISSFSKGMIQRLQLALGLIHQPAILLFDEPMSGLDPSGQKRLRELLSKLKNYTLLYASHNLSEIEEICDRIIILQQGKIKGDITVGNDDKVVFTIESEINMEDLFSQYQSIELRKTHLKNNNFFYELHTTYPQFQEFLMVCKEKEIPILRFRSKSILEDLYERYVKTAII